MVFDAEASGQLPGLGLKLFLCSAADAGGIAFARKASGNRAFGGTTRAYDQTEF